MNVIKRIIPFIIGVYLALVSAMIPMKGNALSLSVKAPVTTDATKLVLVYQNQTGRPVRFCADAFYAERKTEDGWAPEPKLNRTTVREVMTEIQPGFGDRYTIELSEPLDAGEYRISQTYDVLTYTLESPFAQVNRTHTATVEFTVS